MASKRLLRANPGQLRHPSILGPALRCCHCLLPKYSIDNIDMVQPHSSPRTLVYVMYTPHTAQAQRAIGSNAPPAQPYRVQFALTARVLRQRVGDALEQAREARAAPGATAQVNVGGGVAATLHLERVQA